MSGDAERVKEGIQIVDFLRGYLDLKPAGRNFRALCPFHQEKTPSFMVSPERRMWHCFGCGQGGDAIKFLMLYEGIEFPEALEMLAERAGVELSPRRGGGAERQFAALYAVNAAARDFFEEELKKNERAIAYLKGRGVKGETARAFELGYAPGGDMLTVRLLQDGHSINDIVEAGLSVKHSGLYRDRFAGRVMFPLLNHAGKTVGFAGRILDGENISGDIPKYLNSPETPIFQKSKLLYGFSRAKRAIAETKTAFLCEGYMDVIMSVQAGVQNAVAVSGTMLTPAHLTALRRTADTIILSFDSDEAGVTALERALELLGTFDFYVKAVDLGAFKDPAEACEKEPEAFRQKVSDALPAMRRLFEARFSTVADPAERKRIVRRMLALVRRFESSVERDMWLKELSRTSGVSENMLRMEFERALKAGASYGRDDETHADEPVSGGRRIDRIARRLLLLAFLHESFYTEVRKREEFFPDSYRELLKAPSDERGLLELESHYALTDVPREELEKELMELFRNLRIERLRARQREVKEGLAASSGAGRDTLLKEFYALAGEVDKLRRE